MCQLSRNWCQETHRLWTQWSHQEQLHWKLLTFYLSFSLLPPVGLEIYWIIINHAVYSQISILSSSQGQKIQKMAKKKEFICWIPFYSTQIALSFVKIRWYNQNRLVIKVLRKNNERNFRYTGTLWRNSFHSYWYFQVFINKLSYEQWDRTKIFD